MSSDANTGTEYAWPKPTPMRVQNSWNGFTTRPLTAVATAHPMVAIHTMRTRDTRSASHASGTAPSTRATPPNALMPMSVVSLIWSVSWMSGASTPPAARSNCSAIVISASMTTIDAPPARSVSRIGIGSAPTPGRRSSGSTVTADRAACAAWRSASCSSTAAARAAGSWSPSSGSSVGIRAQPCVGIGNASSSGMMHIPSNGILSLEQG